MTLDALNRLSRTEAALIFSRCCGSAQWAKTMALKRPYFDEEQLLRSADAVWKKLSESDWKEAFTPLPGISDPQKTAYQRKFGFGFVAYEPGKTVAEMAPLLQQRMQNTPGDEIRIAAEEQRKIIRLCLQVLFSE